MADFGDYDHNANPDEGYPDPVPADNYICYITESDVKPNSKNTGSIFTFTAMIADGPYEGRKLKGRLNIRNENAEAQRIAQAQLAALWRACCLNVPPTRTEELHNRPFMAKVKVKPASGEYSAQNEFVSFSKVPSDVPERPATQQASPETRPAPRPAPAAQVPAKKPWERR